MLGKILVVDDEPVLLYLLRIILKSEGFLVLVCQNGREALQTIQREKPDLVVLDILMPEMNGWEVCKALRQDRFTQALPIIILSVLPCKEEERQLVKKFQVYDYMTKPFEPLELLAKVKQLFRETFANRDKTSKEEIKDLEN